MKKAVCETCGEEYGTTDATNHVNTELRGVKEATYDDYGYTGDLYCVDCGARLKEGKVIEKLHQEPETLNPEPTPEPTPNPMPNPTPNPTPQSPTQKAVSTITYVLKGGKNNRKNPKNYQTASGVKVCNPSRKGYTFKGWYSDKKMKKRVTVIKKGSTGNKTLYAKWKKK